MDSIFEKFDFFDYLNLIITGGAFLLGLKILFYYSGKYLVDFYILKFFFYNYKDNNIIYKIITIFVLIFICYFIGLIFQEISYCMVKILIKIDNFIFLITKERYKHAFYRFTTQYLIDNLFSAELNNPIINNSVKRSQYIKLANKLFVNKHIKEENTEEMDFTSEQCQYFFTYCLYQIQVNEKNLKIEKLRDIEGLIKSFVTCLSMIVIISIFIFLSEHTVIEWFKFIYIILIIIFILMLRLQKIIRYRIRMTLALYEVISDLNMI